MELKVHASRLTVSAEPLLAAVKARLVVDNKKRLEGCTQHDFERRIIALFIRYQCHRCNGMVDQAGFDSHNKAALLR